MSNRLRLVVLLVVFLLTCFIPAFSQSIIGYAQLNGAEQGSIEINRTIEHGVTVGAGYLFVAAHRLVLGNGLNVPCPQGTSKPENPAIEERDRNENQICSDCFVFCRTGASGNIAQI